MGVEEALSEEKREINRMRDEFIAIHEVVIHLLKHPEEKEFKEMRKKIVEMRDKLKKKYVIVDSKWKMIPLYDKTKERIMNAIKRTNDYQNVLGLQFRELYAKSNDLNALHHHCVISFNELAKQFEDIMHEINRVIKQAA